MSKVLLVSDVFFADPLNVLDAVNYPLMLLSWGLRFLAMQKAIRARKEEQRRRSLEEEERQRALTAAVEAKRQRAASKAAAAAEEV